MSTSVLPSLVGLTFPTTRSPKFQTRKPQAVSGKRTFVSDWSIPLYTWELPYSTLRQGTVDGVSQTEFQQLEAFFEDMQGGGDSFLYTDPDDNSVTDQGLGSGNAGQTITTFPLLRAFGGQVVPVLAPNVVTNVKVNGVVQTLGTAYTVSSWGATAPGVVTFLAGHIPGAVPVTWTGTYYFPCNFDDDSITFSKFMSNRYELKKLSFTSIK